MNGSCVCRCGCVPVWRSHILEVFWSKWLPLLSCSAGPQRKHLFTSLSSKSGNITLFQDMSSICSSPCCLWWHLRNYRQWTRVADGKWVCCLFVVLHCCIVVFLLFFSTLFGWDFSHCHCFSNLDLLLHADSHWYSSKANMDATPPSLHGRSSGVAP